MFNEQLQKPKEQPVRSDRYDRQYGESSVRVQNNRTNNNAVFGYNAESSTCDELYGKCSTAASECSRRETNARHGDRQNCSDADRFGAGDSDWSSGSLRSGLWHSHSDGLEEGRMAEICEHLSRTWSRFNRTERRRFDRLNVRDISKQFRLIYRKSFLMAPALLAGCSTSAIANVEQSISEHVANSITRWYSFVGTVYGEMTKFILHTPEVILNNPSIQHLWMIFVSVAISMLGVVCVVEALKAAIGKSKANFMGMLGRTAMGFTAVGFVLPIMTYAVKFINDFVAFLVNKAQGGMEPSVYFAQVMNSSFTSTTVNLFASTIFLALFLYYMFNILLFYGRRWFDIMVAAVVSPLAFGATVFDSTTHYFQKWWVNITNLYIVQIVHAVYVMVISSIILAPGIFNNATDHFVRLLLLIGALWRMSSPPKLVTESMGGVTTTGFLKSAYNKTKQFRSFGKPSQGGK